jgi:hypothetical protein
VTDAAWRIDVDSPDDANTPSVRVIGNAIQPKVLAGDAISLTTMRNFLNRNLATVDGVVCVAFDRCCLMYSL